MSGTASTTATAPRTDELVEFSWRPQPGPQKALVDCPYPEILFGGARGGGKTDGILGKYALKEKRWGRHFNGVFFRQEMPQQDDLIERAKEIYLPTGAAYHESRKQFLLPHGGRLRFRPLESVVDAAKYQGQSLSDAAVEEAGNYPLPDPIDMLFGCLRSAHGVPVQLMLSANPGGAGHQWLKQRYIDPAPRGMQRLVRTLPNGAKHAAVYIPSKLGQNRILLAKDPDYVNRLYLVGSAELVRAWLEGDWSVIAGAFFPEFNSERHVIAPFEIPAYWPRIRAGDWGSAKPFCILWLAVSDGSVARIPRGALVVYREWYGWSGKANVGCQMTAEQVAAGIAELETWKDGEEVLREKCMDEVLDPSAFSRDGGPSIAERMNMGWRRADNARVARRGAMGGWDQVRERLRGDGDGPGVLIFSTCVHLIRTLPALPHDKHRAEDVDTESEDHACFAAGTEVNGRAIELRGALTRRAARVVRVEFEDGRSIICTPEHRFLCEDGTWQEARKLTDRLALSAPRSRSFAAFGITAAALTFSARAFDCIAWCTSTFTALSLKALMCITWMRIEAITTPTISGPSGSSSTSRCTALIASYLWPRGPAPRDGTGAPLGAAGTNGTGSDRLARLSRSVLRWCARNAGSLMRRAASRQLARGSAIQTARPVRCVAVVPLSAQQDVYCLATKSGWLDAEGLIASNCDALRYGCMSRPIVRDKPGTPPPRFPTQLTVTELIKRQTSKRLAEE